MHTYYVYMMTKWNNEVIYTGVTNDLARRVEEHRSKKIKGFTEKYNLTKLVYMEQTDDVNATIAREKQIKGWMRQKKDALIESVNPSWDEISII